MSALVVARALHYAAIAQAFGALAYAIAISRPRTVVVDAPGATHRSVGALARWGAALALATWCAWLALEASAMSGIEYPRALEAATLWLVIHDTSFGHVWIARFLLLAALAALVARRSVPIRGPRACAALVLAGASIAMLAATGHASAASGADRIVHFAADALHSLAASAWLGALLPLSIDLGASPGTPGRHELVRRFSVLGAACVGVLIATGIVNSVYLVAGWPALFGTWYGELLLAKVALFVSMVALATGNRIRSTPRLASAGPTRSAAARRIARNARLEAALGLAVLAIVGALGVAMPAAHDDPQWPFAWRIAFDNGGRTSTPSIVAAYPTTYMHAKSGYSVASIAHGAAIFAARCVACHGVDGRGDGPAAAALAIRPADLTSAHVLHHRDGDLYWWITHGIEGTPMPAFADLDDPARWDLVQFVKTLALAAAFREDATKHAATAPRFIYQIGQGSQQPVGSPAPEATLLVLYTQPQSNDRLLELAAAAPELAHAGVHVVAFALHGHGSPQRDDDRVAAITAEPPEGLSETYRLFASPPSITLDSHVEFLIDRGGLLRARWQGGKLPRPADLAQPNFARATQPEAHAAEPEHVHRH